MAVKSNADAVAKNLNQYGRKLIVNIDRALLLSMQAISRDAIGYIDKKDLIAFGDLRTSITEDTIRRGDHLLGRSGSNSEHAPFVHEGTRPHWPPVDVMEEWVAQQVARGKMDTDDIKGTAFLVGRAISQRGTKPNPFMSVAERMNRAATQGKIARAMKFTDPPN